MALEVKIRKKFSEFTLETEFETDGCIMGILGASGCGKSMTLKCIAGVEEPDEGRIVLNGRVLYDSDQKINLPARLRRVGYLFQNYALFPTMTVEENLSVVLPGRRKEKRQAVEEQLERFQLTGLGKRYPSQLSGGQQQRVALARMFLCRPEIIMLDEPFSALDGFLKDTLQMEVLKILEDFPGDVLFVSHSRDEIFKFCKDMVLLSEGKSILKGNTQEIFSHPRKMEAARLTGCKNISSARKIDDHHIYAEDWQMQFAAQEEVTENIRYVGIRGHRLVPADAPGENTMEVVRTGFARTPFENQYLFRNAASENSSDIWWMQDRESFPEEDSSFPRFLYFPPGELMLLE